MVRAICSLFLVVVFTEVTLRIVAAADKFFAAVGSDL